MKEYVVKYVFDTILKVDMHGATCIKQMYLFYTVINTLILVSAQLLYWFLHCK